MGGDWLHLHKLLGELQFFCVNISSQLQNAWVLTCWNLLLQKMQRLLVVERISRQLQRLCEDRFYEINWLVGARKGLQAKSFQQNLQNKPVGCKETFLQTFLVNHIKYFWHQPFVAVSASLGGKVPVIDDVLSFHEPEIDPTTSLDENCLEFEFQTDWNYYADMRQRYWELKLKLTKRRRYGTCNSKEVKKEHKKRQKRKKKTAGEAPVPLTTHVNNFLHSIFSTVEEYVNNQ